jgi:NADPH:quinone reductase
LHTIQGIYPHPTPLIIGNEPAGTIVAIGSNVKHLSVGDKAVTFGSLGGYAEFYLGKADMTAKLPNGMTTKMAASSFLQGITGP